MMRRFLQALALLVLVGVAGALIYGARVNPESLPLDDAARAKAPGRFVASARGMTHYEVAGPDSGRPVVLVHGFSVPAYIWDSTSAALGAAGYRVIRYDVFGRGWSDRPDVAYDTELFVGQLRDLLDSLRISQPVDLMGLSFGGLITAQFVAAHPQRVRTWTMVDPVAARRDLPAVLRVPLLGPWIWQSTVVPGMAEGQASDFLQPERFPGWADLYRPQMQYRGFGRALLRSALYSTTVDLESLYTTAGRTGVPTMLVWGKEDQTVPVAHAAMVRRAVPQTEYVLVDSAGHLPNIERAGVVHARMLGFLAAH